MYKGAELAFEWSTGAVDADTVARSHPAMAGCDECVHDIRLHHAAAALHKALSARGG